MLDFAQHADKPFLRLLVLHDDAEREFDYIAGAEDSLERARANGLDGGQHQERLGDGLRDLMGQGPPLVRWSQRAALRKAAATTSLASR